MADQLPDLDGISERWLEHWETTQRVAGGLPPAEMLCRALTLFVAQELEGDAEGPDKRLLLAVILTAVERSRTHSKPALKAAVAQLFPPDKGGIRRLNTRPKRIALLLFPFFATVDAFLLHRDIENSFTWSPSLSFAMFFLFSLGCLLFALTRIGDWVDNG